MPARKFYASVTLLLLTYICSFSLQAQIKIKESVSISPKAVSAGTHTASDDEIPYLGDSKMDMYSLIRSFTSETISMVRLVIEPGSQYAYFYDYNEDENYGTDYYGIVSGIGGFSSRLEGVHVVDNGTATRREEVVVQVFMKSSGELLGFKTFYITRPHHFDVTVSRQEMEYGDGVIITAAAKDENGNEVLISGEMPIRITASPAGYGTLKQNFDVRVAPGADTLIRQGEINRL